MRRAVKIAASLERHCPHTLQPIALAVMSVESGFNPLARSASGDLGLFQLSPRWHADLTDADRVNIDANVERGCGTLFEAWYHYGSREPKAWVGYYHSNKPERRQAYMKKVESQLDRITHELRRCKK